MKCHYVRRVYFHSHARLHVAQFCGAETNLKVGGAPVRRKAPEKILWLWPSTFFGLKSTISCFGERFRAGQYSLVSLLFAVLLLTVPPCPDICKSGGHVPSVPHGVGATGPIICRSS